MFPDIRGGFLMQKYDKKCICANNFIFFRDNLQVQEKSCTFAVAFSFWEASEILAQTRCCDSQNRCSLSLRSLSLDGKAEHTER